MISKRNSKFINSLHIKKYRNQHHAFSVEGGKNICEVLNSELKVQQLFLTENAFEELKPIIHSKRIDTEICTIMEIEKSSYFQTNNFGLAVVNQPNVDQPELLEGKLYLALENVKDPGNLGTILRAADWYGITDVFCSEQCVDFYNPKVISSTMGSFTRINVHYVNLEDFLGEIDVPVYGAALGGGNIHEKGALKPGVLIMGNESNGMSDKMKKQCDHLLMIPQFGNAESLNVAMATTVLLDNLQRLKG